MKLLTTNTIIRKLTELFAKAGAIRYFYRNQKDQLTDDSWALVSIKNPEFSKSRSETLRLVRGGSLPLYFKPLKSTRFNTFYKDFFNAGIGGTMMAPAHQSF